MSKDGSVICPLGWKEVPKDMRTGEFGKHVSTSKVEDPMTALWCLFP